MKLKEFIDIVESKRWDEPGKPVFLEMTAGDFTDLREDCAMVGWHPLMPSRTVGVGTEVTFGPARVLIVEVSDPPEASSWLVGSYKVLSGDEPVDARSKGTGTVVNISGSVIGTIDQDTAEKIAEQVEKHCAEQMSAGYDREPEGESSIWQELRDRIEDAVERDNYTDALRWLEVAERVSLATRQLGFDSDPWVAPEKQ